MLRSRLGSRKLWVTVLSLTLLAVAGLIDAAPSVPYIAAVTVAYLSAQGAADFRRRNSGE